MSSIWLTYSGAPIADHWATPISFPPGFAYLALYLGAIFVPIFPLLILLVISSGRPFAYRVVQSRVLFIAPDSLRMPIRSILSFVSVS